MKPTTTVAEIEATPEKEPQVIPSKTPSRSTQSESLKTYRSKQANTTLPIW